MKNIAIIDIVCVSIGFVLRVLAGNVIVPSFLPSQVFLLTFTVAALLTLVKRKYELINFSYDIRYSLKNYNIRLINKLITTLIFVSSIIYSFLISNNLHLSPYGIAIFCSSAIIFALLLCRLSILGGRNTPQDFINIFFKDKLLIIIFILFLITIMNIF